MSSKNELLGRLPSMHAVLEAFAAPGDIPCAAVCLALSASVPRSILRQCIENFFVSCRRAVREGRINSADELSLPALLPCLLRHVQDMSRPHLRRVLNATGVIIHTNLGRSPLAPEALKAVNEAASRYCNLEFDLQSGSRGSRHSHVEDLICRLTGAEGALLVNNNAAAVLLLLDTLCKDREVVISRGELVEIGGHFRIPDLMEKSGCRLREVGATNCTHIEDYAAAVHESTAALMKVQSSNFRIVGFTKAASRVELAALARERNLPLLEDLGSSTLIDFAAAGFPQLATEPAAATVLAQGADVITFSGDKTLGGPQAGIIAGKSAYIDRLKQNPLMRALRVDKMTLAALEATLRLYCEPKLAVQRIPVLRMLCMSREQLRRSADSLARVLKKCFDGSAFWGNVSVSVRQGVSRCGGGVFPEHDLPTWLVCLHTATHAPDVLRQRLLHTDPAVVLTVQDNALCFDPRTLDKTEYKLLAAVLKQVLEQYS